MYIINAPWFFTAIWAVMKYFSDERTRKKVTILGSKYMKELLKHVDEDNLADFVGGNSKCVLSENKIFEDEL